jgi:Autotransporter beta-domain
MRILSAVSAPVPIASHEGDFERRLGHVLDRLDFARRQHVDDFAHDFFRLACYRGRCARAFLSLCPNRDRAGLRQPRCAPALEVSDIANNALTTAFSMGAVGLDWQVTGFGNFSGNPNETDMIMRNGNTGPFNWYIDAVLQWTYVEGNPMSVRGVSNNIRGRELAGSIEAGYPIALMAWLTFEPQIQGIWQRVSFDDTQDPFSTITFDRANVFTGRAGWVLRGSFGSIDARWQPYLKGNVWWGSNGFDTVRFDDVPIQTGRNGTTTLEGGGGITGKLTRNVGVYADASYLGSIAGEQRITIKGNAACA